MPSICKAVLMKGYNFTQLKRCRLQTATGHTFACRVDEKIKYTNLLLAVHFHTNVTSVISTKREFWNNVSYKKRRGRPLEQNVDNGVLCYPHITAQPKC